MIVTLDAKRRLRVPTTLAPAQPGEHFQAEFDALEDAFVFRRVANCPNWLQVLKECPGPMDDLPPRHRAHPRRQR
jgi:hypothetical protein